MLKLLQICKCIILVLIGGAMFCQPSFGKLRVTKKVSSTGLNHLSIFSKDGASYSLYCNCYYTLITTDAKGKTHVYVNDSGSSSYSSSSDYEVDLSEFPEIDWSDVAIYAGMEKDDASFTRPPHIKMEGGQVGSITLLGSGKNNVINAHCYLDIHGGTVERIYVGNGEQCSIGSSYKSYVYMENLNYTGFAPIYFDGREANTRLLIAPSCKFFYDHALPKDVDFSQFLGAVVPNYNGSAGMVFAYNAASINTGYTVNCDMFYDRGTSALYIGGNLNIRTCGGWNSEKDIANYPKVKIPAHQHQQYITRPATCTEDALYVSNCVECGTEIPTTLNVTKLGHSSARTASLASTCYRTGHTAGTHCSRCGETITRIKTTLEKAHDYDTIYYSYKSKNRPSCITISSGSSSVKIVMCKTCGYWKVISGGGSCTHTTQAENLSATNGTVISAASCDHSGWVTSKCPYCKHTIGKSLPRKDHVLSVSQEEIEATCTSTGYHRTYRCSLCSLYFATNSVTNRNYILTNKQKTPALGHRFGSTMPNPLTHTLVKEATCTEPAVYKDRCRICNAENDTMFVSGMNDVPKGHSYYLKNLTYASWANPEEGYVQLGCENCSEEIKYLPFFLCRDFGRVNSVPANAVSGEHGYWCKSKLKEITKLPTCVDGEGIYEMTLCYAGKIMRGTYSSRIRPCGYLHNYDNSGVCREKHYKMAYDGVTGEIQKDGIGNIKFSREVIATTPFIMYGDVIVDNATYSAKAWIAKPVQIQAFGPNGIISGQNVAYIDPEDGSQMTYTDFDVTTYSSISAFNTAVAQQTSPFYAGTYGGYNLASYSNILKNPYYLSLDTHNGSLSYSLADAAKYEAGTDFNLSSLTYTRSFTNSNWQPFYVPFPVSVSTLESKGLQVARLNDTHMYDDDFDGTIDRVTLEFIRVTSGTLQANRPYMVRSTTSSNSLSLSLNQVKLAQAVEASVECSTVDQKITITGTYQGLAAGVMYNNNYYAMSGSGALQRAQTSSATLKPQRWYMKFENKDGSRINNSDYLSAEIRVLGFDDDDDITTTSAIDDMTSDNVEGEQPVYSLDGTRVSGNQPLRKGVYVENGKRIIVR
ncbi:MAG: hypothetical protein IJT28_08330 [Bacteroidaceae bacterium]|nr:hypothetical protein [Bacteroidaceae bacterium]